MRAMVICPSHVARWQAMQHLCVCVPILVRISVGVLDLTSALSTVSPCAVTHAYLASMATGYVASAGVCTNLSIGILQLANTCQC